MESTEGFQRGACRHQAISPDGTYGVFFASHQIATIDLANPKGVGHVPEHPSVMSPEMNS